MTDRATEIKEQQEHQRHQTNLARPSSDDDTAPETLTYISEPEDIDPGVDALEWINSKSSSTANLTEEDVRSKEWILEIHQLVAPMEHPPEYGLTGHLRAWAYDDREEFKKPRSVTDRMKTEGAKEVARESNTRSKEGWGVETATRDTKESIVRDGDSDGGGGLLGRLRG